MSFLEQGRRRWFGHSKNPLVLVKAGEHGGSITCCMEDFVVVVVVFPIYLKRIVCVANIACDSSNSSWSWSFFFRCPSSADSGIHEYNGHL
jgi:hypothetical protein